SKVTVSGDDGTDTMTINDAATAGRNYIINSTSVKQGKSTVDVATLEGLKIKAPNQVNTFEVQSMTPSMPLTLTGGTLSDTVTINDTGASAIMDYRLDAGKVVRSVPFGGTSLVTGTVNYGAINKLIVNSGSGDNTFTMTNTTQPTLEINGGGGTD